MFKLKEKTLERKKTNRKKTSAPGVSIKTNNRKVNTQIYGESIFSVHSNHSTTQEQTRVREIKKTNANDING